MSYVCTSLPVVSFPNIPPQYSPTSPAYSPTSPAYSPTSPQVGVPPSIIGGLPCFFLLETYPSFYVSTLRRVQHTAQHHQLTLQRARRWVLSTLVRAKASCVSPLSHIKLIFILSVLANKSSLQPYVTSLQSDKPSGTPSMVATLCRSRPHVLNLWFTLRLGQYSPTSPAYSPTSPQYSPTSPAYSPTSPQVCLQDTFDHKS